MFDVNFVAVLVCAIGGFILSTIWYSAFSKQMAKLHKAYATDKQPEPWQVLIELGRNILLSIVIATLFYYLGVRDVMSAIQFGLLIWLGFPLVLLTGSVLWEKVPPKLAAFHLGDWFIKIILFSVILTIWR
jgi:hypothetical protein